MARHDAAGGGRIASGSDEVLNISKVTEGLSRGLKVYEQGAHFPTWRKVAESFVARFQTRVACLRVTRCL